MSDKFLWQLSVFQAHVSLDICRKSGFYVSPNPFWVCIAGLGTLGSLAPVCPVWTDPAGEGRALEPGQTN